MPNRVRKYREYDKAILSHIGEYGLLTVRQCASIFYSNNKYPQSEAHRKLKAMFDKKILKRCKDKMSSQWIYYLELNEVPTMSNVLLMDFFAEMTRLGAKVIEFKKEVEWKSMIVRVKPMRSDGYIVYNYKNKSYVALIEVDVTHRYELENYERLYETGEVQELLKKTYGISNFFPPVIVITKKLSPPRVSKIKVSYITYEMDGIEGNILT